MRRLSIFLVLALCAGCKQECTTVTVQQAKTHNEMFQAKVYVETCGETVWTHVSVMQTRDAFPEQGNVLRVEGVRDVSVYWMSNKTLKIDYPAIVYPAFQAEGSVQSVNLVYSSIDPREGG